MSIFDINGNWRRVAFPAALLLTIWSGSAALAQSQTQVPDAITPVEEFSKQLDQFKRTIPELNRKIEESTTSVDRWTDVNRARKEIEELRAIVGAALGAVSDNGVVSQLGSKALAHAREKLRALQQDSRFKPEEKQFLVEQWQQTAGRDRACHRRACDRAQGVHRTACASCRPTRTSSTSWFRSGRRRRRST